MARMYSRLDRLLRSPQVGYWRRPQQTETVCCTFLPVYFAKANFDVSCSDLNLALRSRFWLSRASK